MHRVVWIGCGFGRWRRGSHRREPLLAARTQGFEELRRSLLGCDTTYVERVTGVSLDKIRRAVELMARAESCMLLSGRGAEQQSKGTDTVLAFTPDGKCLVTAATDATALIWDVDGVLPPIKAGDAYTVWARATTCEAACTTSRSRARTARS
ncbi:MAG: hypothetical protein HC794_06335 [Nitrospiraceae bacterium]|nr:hypothetical protein [Nitrospiraceae bacterium]